MVQFTVDARQLLQWARHLDEVPRITKSGVARSLNQLGSSVARTMAQNISQSTGLSVSEVSRLFRITRANSESLFWEIDASRVIGRAPGGRPMPQRGWTAAEERAQFGQLVKVITAEDNDVCPVCEEIADGGPYTREYINSLARKWANYTPPASVRGERTNLMHPNCRCAVEVFHPTRRVPVQSTRGLGIRGATTLSISQLSRMVAEAAEEAAKIVATKI